MQTKTYQVSVTDADDLELQHALTDTGMTAEEFIVETLQSELATRRMRRLYPKEVEGDRLLDTLTRAAQMVEEDDLNTPVNSTISSRISHVIQQRVLNQESR